MNRIKWAGVAMGLAAFISAGAASAADLNAPGPSHLAATGTDPNLSTEASGNVGGATNPRALACEQASKFGDFNGVGIDECTLALRNPLMSAHDQATIYNDRGAIYMQHKMFAKAQTDFDAAVQLDPNLANAYVNRGGVMIALKRYTDAVADIDHGLSLNPDMPERAYYNRGIADEHLKDNAAAYADYLKASQLKPDWPAPKNELSRFAAHEE